MHEGERNMSTFEQQIDAVRAYFKEHKAERYPFENPYLREKEEYIQSLYYRMLCALVRYPDEPDDMQVLYIRRLMAGAQAEHTFQDYMKMALDLDTDDINEFISAFHEDELRFYFCVDGLVLLSAVQAHEKAYALLSELIELLGITKDELRYLSAIAAAIVTQSSQAFDSAKALATHFTKHLSFYPYIRGFYSGLITDTSAEKHIYFANGGNISLSQYGPYTAKRVVIENISCVLDQDINFEGCAEVILRNCTLKGNEYQFQFYYVRKIMIENCNISDFSNRFAYLKNSTNLFVQNNRFENCGYCGKTDALGGVFYNYASSMATNIVNFINNEFFYCYIARNERKLNMWATGIIFSSSFSVKTLSIQHNRFYGCECRNNDTRSEVYICASANEKVEEGNICTGPVTQIFE